MKAQPPPPLQKPARVPQHGVPGLPGGDTDGGICRGGGVTRVFPVRTSGRPADPRSAFLGGSEGFLDHSGGPRRSVPSIVPFFFPLSWIRTRKFDAVVNHRRQNKKVPFFIR